MRHRHLAVVPALLLVLTACSGGTGSGSPAATAASPSSPAASSPSGSSAAAITIDVKLTDALRMEPAQMTVPIGQAVRFVVTNSGATDHEFFVGDQAAQQEHADEMKSMGGMMAHDDENGIGLKPGETKELTHTFVAAGTLLAGCHVNAHYNSGMKATITVR